MMQRGNSFFNQKKQTEKYDEILQFGITGPIPVFSQPR